ncbi:MAG: DUF2029 domain-containing protein, partial [Acidobacteriaceae bacterium]|nr:DUF2029 domain-containing protein [Acidobacteriaceae bacterium]
AASFAVLLRTLHLPRDVSWLLAAICLLFSPVSSGLSTGNPGVFSCALVLMAVLLVRQRPITSALALGIAHCLKPQISICAVALFVLAGYWRPLLLSFVLPVISALISLAHAHSFDQYRLWIRSLEQGVAATVRAGGLNDPRPSNFFSYNLINAQAIFGTFISNLRLDDILTWAVAGALLALYLGWLRRRRESSYWKDAAFLSALTLTVVYHRYYDSQLLLLAVPLVAFTWREESHWTTAAVFCFAVLEFPLQAIAAQTFHNQNADSLIGFMLYRHQPLLVLFLAGLFAFWPVRHRTLGTDVVPGPAASPPDTQQSNGNPF